MARTERGATQETVRRHNLATLLGHVHRYGPTSRARLTGLLGLNRATIGGLVDELAAKGLVQEEVETDRVARGRPSKVVATSSERFHVLAIQVGVDSVQLGMMGLGGTMLGRRRAPVNRPEERTVEQVLRTLSRLGSRLLAQYPGVLAGVGVAVPGSVSPRGGVVHFAPNLGWHQVPLATLLAERLGVDAGVRVGNDANLGAIAEHSRGVGIRANDLIYLHAEVGVGGGVITGGRMLEGSHGYAGEVGHMQVNPSGLACHCGARGCWETEVGEAAMARRAGLPVGTRAEAVLRRARQGDERCRSSVEATARWIAVGILNLMACFDPEMVIMGGVFTEVLRQARPVLAARLSASLQYAEPLPLEAPGLEGDSVLIGAAELALQSLLQDPASVDQAWSATQGAERPLILSRPA